MEEFERDIRILERRISRVKPSGDLTAFYGSSTIRLWVRMQKDLDPLDVINLGFGGSNFDACIHYFDRVFDQLNPSQIVLYGGDNDLSLGYDEIAINSRFKTLCEKIREKYPEIRLFGITIKPSPQREDKMETIKLANELMKQTMDSLGNAIQIDSFQALLGSDGKPQPHLYMDDGLHLNNQGYEVWAASIRKLLI